jgi:hypothetical protein
MSRTAKETIPWAEALDKSAQTSGVLWKPHKTNGYLIVACKKHYSPSGLLIYPGYQVRFFTPELRNRWLRAQYPKRYRRLR